MSEALEGRIEIRWGLEIMIGVVDVASSHILVAEPQDENRMIIGAVCGVVDLMKSFQTVLQLYEF